MFRYDRVGTEPIEWRYRVSKEKVRILKAIADTKHPFSFEVKNLNENVLAKIAHLTNEATIHCSGNCELLAEILLYNLKIGSVELCAKNTFPLYKPVSLAFTTQIIFGDSCRLQTVACFLSINTLEKILLSKFKTSGERVFIVGINGFFVKHSLNAVVVGENESVRVIFVDAWKKIKTVYSMKELQDRYPGHVTADIRQISSGAIPRFNNEDFCEQLLIEREFLKFVP